MDEMPAISLSQDNDPTFLVAKGRFRSSLEKPRDELFSQRDYLLRRGYAGDSSEVVDLTIKIDKFNGQIEKDQSKLEKNHVRSLSSAVSMSLWKHGITKIRSCGRHATYNAVKAIAMVREGFLNKGLSVVSEIHFDEGNLGDLRSQNHVQSLTAIVFSVKLIKHGENNA